jgi:hypothetical protein
MRKEHLIPGVPIDGQPTDIFQIVSNGLRGLNIASLHRPLWQKGRQPDNHRAERAEKAEKKRQENQKQYTTPDEIIEEERKKRLWAAEVQHDAIIAVKAKISHISHND